MTGQEDNKALARRYAALMESGTVDRATAVLSPDLRFHPPGSPASVPFTRPLTDH